MTGKIKDTDDLQKYQKDYSETKLWNKLSVFAGKIGREALYQTLVLYYVMKSPNVSMKYKATVCGALGYLILPFDMIPDAIPALGLTDDISAIAVAYKAVLDAVTPEIEQQARDKIKEWF